MGINIILYKKVGVYKYEDLGPELEAFDCQRVEWWDSIRRVGDNDFLNGIEWEYIPDGDDKDFLYQRPANIEDAITFVQCNLNGGRKDDYLEALNLMKTDLDLMFFVSR